MPKKGHRHHRSNRSRRYRKRQTVAQKGKVKSPQKTKRSTFALSWLSRSSRVEGADGIARVHRHPESAWLLSSSQTIP